MFCPDIFMQSNNKTNDKIEYFDLIDIDPVQFNKEQEEKRNKLTPAMRNEIMYSDKHHELKTRKTLDLRLSDEEKNNLLKNGVYFKNTNFTTFASMYLQMYNNDLPIIITSDSMLHALHKLYDEYLEFLEENVLIEQFKKLCSAYEECIKETLKDTKNKNVVEMVKSISDFMNIVRCLCEYDEKTKKINSSDEKIREQVLNINGGKDFMYEFGKSMPKVDILVYGSYFKPRGHYTNSQNLKNYFRSFKLMSNLKFEIFEVNKEESIKILSFIAIFCKISEKNLEMLKFFKSLIELIIGNSDNYDVESFLNIVNEYLTLNFSGDKSLVENIEYIYENEISFANFFFSKNKKTDIKFNLIGNGSNVDNDIIREFVDKKFSNVTGDMRKKYPSIFDLSYVLYGKYICDLSEYEKRREEITQKNQTIEVNYKKYLDDKYEKYHNEINKNSIYGKQLDLLQELGKNNKDSFPFNTQSWLFKQTQAQLGHYAEMRHDNVLYLDEPQGFGVCCYYPGLIVEPVQQFWEKYRGVIEIMKQMKNYEKKNGDPKSQEYYVYEYKSRSFDKRFENFKKALDVFDNYFAEIEKDGKASEATIDYLKALASIKHEGSGMTSYGGWYISLFGDKEKCLRFKPEISTFFTGVPDDRDGGGIMHLGTGSVNIVYLIVEDEKTKNRKIYFGPCYSVYEFKTTHNDRLSDGDWIRRIKDYEPLNFNNTM